MTFDREARVIRSLDMDIGCLREILIALNHLVTSGSLLYPTFRFPVSGSKVQSGARERMRRWVVTISANRLFWSAYMAGPLSSGHWIKYVKII